MDRERGKNIVLVGFMGTGKSAVAKIMATRTGKKLVEMDALIEGQEGMTVEVIFAQKGEPYFRAREREMVQRLSSQSGLVISTGGGVVLNPDNVEDFRKGGTVICLSASPETIFKRVKSQTHRPLLKTPNPLETIKELLAARAPFYEKADAQVNTDGKSLAEIAAEVERIISDNS